MTHRTLAPSVKDVCPAMNAWRFVLLLIVGMLNFESANAQDPCQRHMDEYYAEIRQAIANGLKEFSSALTERRLEQVAAEIALMSLETASKHLPSAKENLKGAEESGGFGEGPAARYEVCWLEARIARIAQSERRTAVQTRSVGNVKVSLEFDKFAVACYRMTVTNATGKHVDAFVRVRVQNRRTPAETTTSWIGDPTAVSGTVISTGSAFTNMVPTVSARTIALGYVLLASRDMRGPNHTELTDVGLPPDCSLIEAWLPEEALRWNENAVQQLVDRNRKEMQDRQAQEIAALERNSAQRAAMDAKLKAFMASPRGSVWCKWYKKPEDQYACMRKACSSKSFGDEPSCAMPD